MEIAKLVATLCAALFAGASLYISLVEHPARLACGTELAATVFGPSYRRATRLQVPLALVGFAGAVVVALSLGSAAWLLGGLLLVAVVPYTLLVILPTNRRLLAPSLDRSAASTQALLVRWGRLHALRSVLSLAALIIFILSR